MYRVFNPLTGTYLSCDTKEQALIKQTEIKNQFAEQQVPYVVVEEFTEEKQIANEYAAINFGEPEVAYTYSDYDVSEGKQLNRIFRSQNYGIKVANNSVVEIYAIDDELNGVQHAFISLDMETQEPIEYYNLSENNDFLVKYDLEGNELRKYYFDMSLIPAEYKDKLDALGVFEAEYWTIKDNNLILGLIENRIKRNEELSAEEKAIIDEKRATLLEERQNEFVINEIFVSENGNETWTVLNMKESI